MWLMPASVLKFGVWLYLEVYELANKKVLRRRSLCAISKMATTHLHSENMTMCRFFSYKENC
jgi:hypothetical protein